MEKHKNSIAWTEAGYELFAREGLDGIQVERLARILRRNKSGFYHYFGDVEGFCSELLNLHKQKTGAFLGEAQKARSLDPDCLCLVVRYANTVMFQVQLTRHRDNHFFYSVSETFDQKATLAFRRPWCEYLDVPIDSDMGIRYFAIVRDMFYTRISFQNLNYTFLHDFIRYAKSIVDELGDRNAVETVHPPLASVDDAV